MSKGVIAWFARNAVAANLLMIAILVGGLLTVRGIKQEVYPEFSADVITVLVAYPGAAPTEVEEGVCIKVEEQLAGLAGIKRLTSTAAEGSGSITIEVLEGADTGKVLEEVKAHVDAITTFPDESERPVVREITFRKQVLSVAIAGDVGERGLRAVAEHVRDDIAALPEVTLVELGGARPYEIAIEVSEQALRRHQLTFDDVAAAVRRSSIDLPGGAIDAEGGEILLRAKGQAYDAEQFARLPIVVRPDGFHITVGDVARVLDGFEDTGEAARFNGEPVILVQVFRVGEQSAPDISAAVSNYLEGKAPSLPERVSATVWQDDTVALNSRMDIVLRNARDGLLLVLIVLTLFLRFRLAMWVAVGIPISFLGVLWLMPALGVSVNLISLFGFIIVLGIVVDDAIVVGESIHTHRKQGGDPVEATIRGAKAVSTPVVFAVLTSVAAFGPLLFVPGAVGKFWAVIPIVVIATLLFSLVESLLILPAHLAHGSQKEPRGIAWLWRKIQDPIAGALVWVSKRLYAPSLRLALRWRYLTVSAAIGSLVLTAGAVAGGFLQLVFFEPIEADNVVATIVLPRGSSIEATQAATDRLEHAALELGRQLDDDGGTPEGVIRHVMAAVGDQPTLRAQRAGERGEHVGEVNIELLAGEKRGISATEIARRWRELAGSIPGVSELTFRSDLMNVGDAVNVQLSGHSLDDLRAAADEIKERMALLPGVTDVGDSLKQGKKELQLTVLPAAGRLGVPLRSIATQVRQGFHGEEVQRVQRGRDDVRVVVRYPESERRSLADLENMRIRGRDGAEIPFGTVAHARLGRGYSAIQHVDRQRAVNVTADVDSAVANENDVRAALEDEIVPEVLAAHPGIDVSYEGAQREQAETLGGLARGFGFAMLLVFALLAVPLKSYTQPFVIMSAIPFGGVGAAIGHMVMGLDLSVLSLCGLVAVSGIVVNDSLVLVDYVNRRIRDGDDTMTALRAAGVARFRAIVLTSLTTVAGLTPLLMERSLQARMLIPMAVSIAFGVLFATFVTLVLVPTLLAVHEDIVGLFRSRVDTERERQQLLPIPGLATRESALR